MEFRSIVTRLILIVGVIVFSLLLIEGGFRVAYWGSPIKAPEWMATPRYAPGELPQPFTPDEVLKIPDSVIFLGASSMAGSYPIEQEELVHSIIERELGIPTINHPLPGSGSRDLVAYARAAAPLHPKAVVIYFGHNDETRLTFEITRHPGSSRLIELVPTEVTLHPAINKIEASIILKSYLAYWLYSHSSTMGKRFRWYPSMSLDDYNILRTLSTNVTRGNFLQIRDCLEQEGVHLVLMTVLTNVQTDYGNMTPRDIKPECGGTIYFKNASRLSSCEIVEQGRQALAQGNREEGLRLLRNGMAYAKIGNYNPVGATPCVNNMIRTLAEEHDIILVDTEKHFDEIFIKGEVEYGCDMFGNPKERFCDSLHPNAKSHRVMAELLAPVLSQLTETK